MSNNALKTDEKSDFYNVAKYALEFTAFKNVESAINDFAAWFESTSKKRNWPEHAVVQISQLFKRDKKLCSQLIITANDWLNSIPTSKLRNYINEKNKKSSLQNQNKMVL